MEISLTLFKGAASRLEAELSVLSRSHDQEGGQDARKAPEAPESGGELQCSAADVDLILAFADEVVVAPRDTDCATAMEAVAQAMLGLEQRALLNREP